MWLDKEMTMTQLNPHTAPQNEAFRLTELYRLELLNTAPDGDFDAVVQLGKDLFNTDFCTVALLDDERQWFKAKAGISVAQTSKEDSFCKYTIQSDEPYVINDAESDIRIQNSPLVTGTPWIRSYLGIPLSTLKGARVGTYCLIDTKVRNWTDSEIRLAQKLAKIIERLLHRQEHHLSLGFKLTGANGPATLENPVEYGAWELREGETLVTLSPSLHQMFGIRDDLPVHKNWFERFGVNRPLDSWTECIHDIDCAEPIKYSILRSDGERAYFEESLYVKDTGKKNTLVGLVRRINQQTSIESSVPDALQWHERPIDAPHSMPISELLRNKGYGYAVLDASQSIISIIDHLDKEILPHANSIKLSECFSEADCADIMEQFANLLAGQPANTLFVKLKSETSRGQWMKLNVSIRLVRGCSNTPERVIQFVQLIEQPEVKRRTSVSHSLNELLENSTYSGAWYFSIPEHKIHPTPHVCVLMNLRPMPTLSKDYFFGRLSEMTRRDINKQVNEVILRKMKLTFEFNSSNEMNDPTTFHGSIEPCLNTKGDVVGVRGVLRDITELRTAQLNLFELEDLSERVIQNMGEGIIDVNEHGLVCAANRQAVKMLSIESGQYTVGAPVSDLLAMCSKSSIMQLTQSMTVNGSSQVVKIHVKDLNTWLSVQLFARTQGFRVLLRDITQQIDTENLLNLLKEALNQTENAILITTGIDSRRGEIKITHANQGFEAPL